jgi:hypothetical protein
MPPQNPLTRENPIDLNAIQYPIGYQPYSPPPPPSSPSITFPTTFQPLASSLGMYMPEMGSITNPTTTVSAQRAGYNIPTWMKNVGTFASGFYEGSLEPIVHSFQDYFNKTTSAPSASDAIYQGMRPFAQPIMEAAQVGGRLFQNETDPLGTPWTAPQEERRKQAAGVGLGLIGLPEGTTQAYENKDYTRLAGIVGGAATLNALMHYMGTRRPAPPKEATPAPPIGAPPDVSGPSGPGGGGGDYTQPRLPGMESFDFTRQIPEAQYKPPAEPSMADTQRRVFAGIDAQVQQVIFELTLERAEAQRAGDIATVTQIDNAILEAKMKANDLKRNWQAPPEQPAFQYPAMPDAITDQGDLSGFSWRQNNKFTKAENIPGEQRQGVFRPTPFQFAEPEAAPMIPGEPADVTPTVAPELPAIIDMPTDKVELELRKAEGYRTIPGDHRNPLNGRQQMVRGPQADMLPTTPAPVATPVVGPMPAAGAARKTIGKFRMGDDISVPTDIVNADPNYIPNMAENGYKPISDTNGVTLFRHESRSGVRMGTMDIGEMINLLTRGLREISDSGVAAKIRSAIQELRARLARGETQADQAEIVRMGIPNLDVLAQELGIDIPGVRQPEVGLPIRGTIGRPQDLNPEQRIREARNIQELEALGQQFSNDYEAARGMDDNVGMERAYQLSRAVTERHNELLRQDPMSPPSMTVEDYLRFQQDQEIQNATTTAQLDDLVRHWRTLREEATRAGDTVREDRATGVLADISVRRAQLNRQSAESQAAQSLPSVETAEYIIIPLPRRQFGIVRNGVIIERFATRDAAEMRVQTLQTEGPTAQQGQTRGGPTDSEVIRTTSNIRDLDLLDQAITTQHENARRSNNVAEWNRTGQLLQEIRARRRELEGQGGPSNNSVYSLLETRILTASDTQTLHNILTDIRVDTTNLNTQQARNLLELVARRSAELQANPPASQNQPYELPVDVRALAARTVPEDDGRVQQIRRATGEHGINEIIEKHRSAYYAAAAAGNEEVRLASYYLFNLARQRRAEIRASGPARTEPLRGRAESPQETSLYALDARISNARGMTELLELRREVEALRAEHIADSFYPGIRHTESMLDRISDMLAEPKQDRLGLEDRPSERVPITEGLQPEIKGNVRVSERQAESIRQRLIARGSMQQTNKRDPALARYNPRWDSFATDELSYITDGPPGLSIERTYGTSYNIVYRAPDGTAIAKIKVTERSDGTRTSGMLAANRFYGQEHLPRDQRRQTSIEVSRGIQQIVKKIVELDAVTTNEAISDFTSHLLHKIQRKVDTGIDTSSKELADLISTLLRVKQLEGQPRRIRTPEDMADLIVDMLAAGAEQPELPFKPRAGRNAAEPIVEEVLPEQPNLDWSGAEQMPLPLQSAITPKEGAVSPKEGNTTAQRWTTLVKQLDEMKAPDELYRQIIASPNTPPLKAGETWRSRVLNGIAFFESKLKKGIESLGTEGGEEGAINIGGMIQGTREIIESFFARGPKTPENPKGTPSTFEQLIGLPTAATTIADLSMPLRQGLAAIMTPEWWSGLRPMWDAFKSGEVAKQLNDQIRNNKVHQKEFNPSTGKWEPSYAERSNMKLIEGSNVSASENGVASTWIETGGNLGGVSRFYSKSWGKVARASNRAAATFLNHLRTGMLERLSDQAQIMAEGAADTGSARPGLIRQKFTPEQAANLNPYYNDQVARVIADYINTATGRAPLKLDIIPIPGAPALPMEFAAKALSWVLFSPRNMFSRMRMMSPATYVMAPPFVRKQYLKSAMATAAAWGTMTMLAKVGTQALGYDSEVSMDEESADFGKMRIGKTRLDLGGGFLPFYVAAWRLWDGYFRSSSTNQRHAYGQGYRPETQRSQLQRFFENKFNPAAKFGWDLLDAAQYTPFHVADRTAQLFVPLVGQDLVEMFKEDPKLIPILMPAVVLGGGTQIYGRGETVAKLVPKKYDWVVKGGGLKDIMYPPDWQIFGGK